MTLPDLAPTSSTIPDPPPPLDQSMNPFAPTETSVAPRNNSRMRSNSKRRRNDTEMLVREAEQLLESVADPNITGILSKMLHMLKSLTDGMTVLLQQAQNFPQFNATTTNNPSRSQGNEPAVPSKQTYKEVAAIKVVGQRKDTVQLVQPVIPEEQITDNIPQKIAQDIIDRLIPKPKSAQHHNITVLRYSRVAPRKDVNAKKWKEILKDRKIIPYSVLHPQSNTIEILIPTDQLQNTTSFFNAMERSHEDSNPYARRDGRNEPLPPQIIQRYIKNRLQMLKFERSLIAAQYIQKTIQQGIALLPAQDQPSLLLKLNALLAEKSMPKSNLLQSNQTTT